MQSHVDEIRRFNYWSREPESGFRREMHLQRLAKFRDSKLIKVLTGQRRSGKSYVMRQVIADLIHSGVHPESTLYINKEYPEFDFVSTAADLTALVNHCMQDRPEGERFHVFVDEVHHITEWEKAVNALSQDFTQNISIYIAGSNAKLLSGELATLLSGRYVNFLVLPFSLQEFAGYKQLPMNKQTFLQYLQTGGLPELFHLPDEESRRQYVHAIYDTVLMRDVIERYQIRDVILLKDIFAYLANNVSTLTSVGNLVKYFEGQRRKTNYETVSQYIGHLEDAFIIHKCERYNIKGKDVLGGTAKYYLNDLAFKNYLYPGNSHGYGHMLENLVYLHLRNTEYTVYCGQLRDREVDFVAQKAGETHYFQSAWQLTEEQTREREYRSLLSIRDQFPKAVVSADDLSMPSYEGVRNQLFWEWVDT